MGWVLRVTGTLALGALAGCAGSGALGADPRAAPLKDPPGTVNVMVLQARELELEQDGSVLDAMRGNLPAVRIDAGAGECPAVAMRGPDTDPEVTEPGIYVDGTAMTNTCILNELPANEVARVEVYPSGVTSRGGYAPNAHGLILVFTKRAADDRLGTAARR